MLRKTVTIPEANSLTEILITALWHTFALWVNPSPNKTGHTPLPLLVALPATTMFFYFISPSVCVFASLSRNLNGMELNTPNLPPLLACFTTLKNILHTNEEHRPWQPNSYWDSNWMSERPLKDKARRSPFKTHPWLFAFVALQHWAAYAAATESSDGVCCCCLWMADRPVQCGEERQTQAAVRE